MRRDEGVQDDLIAVWSEIPRSPGHAFYDKLQKLLRDSGFDAFVEDLCKQHYAATMGAPSLQPGRYFRMHMVGYFEGIDSERGIAWRCADSFSLRDFLRLSSREKVPDHSWLSKTRSRLPHEAHAQVFGWVLKLVAGRGLVRGERIGVDGSTMEANAALRTIVRRDNGETYKKMLTLDASSHPSSARSSRRDRPDFPSPRSTASCPCACDPTAPSPPRSASQCRSPSPCASTQFPAAINEGRLFEKLASPWEGADEEEEDAARVHEVGGAGPAAAPGADYILGYKLGYTVRHGSTSLGRALDLSGVSAFAETGGKGGIHCRLAANERGFRGAMGIRSCGVSDAAVLKHAFREPRNLQDLSSFRGLMRSPVRIPLPTASHQGNSRPDPPTGDASLAEGGHARQSASRRAALFGLDPAHAARSLTSRSPDVGFAPVVDRAQPSVSLESLIRR